MSLSDLIRAEIARRGPIPFRDFMERALYHPEGGYYASGRATIGRGGDFFTNVSVGSLFGTLLARQFAEIWERLGRPRLFTIVEQGVHRGAFARDALTALRALAREAFAATRYVIVEPVPRLAAVQQAELGEFAHRVEWFAELAELTPFTGVHFSNELLDAFPIHLVTWTGSEWLERHVASAGDAFHFIDRPLSSPALGAHLALLPSVPPGYVTEVNLAAARWLGEVAARLQRGYLLAIDYGYPRAEYYRAERTAGTLSAYASHRREPNPLARPGEIDLTAHVDFTTLADAAEPAGLQLAGFTDQHRFMVGVSRLHFGDEPPSSADLRAFKTLMHPELMGHSFHAICFSRGAPEDQALAGFQFARSPKLPSDATPSSAAAPCRGR